VVVIECFPSCIIQPVEAALGERVVPDCVVPDCVGLSQGFSHAGIGTSSAWQGQELLNLLVCRGEASCRSGAQGLVVLGGRREVSGPQAVGTALQSMETLGRKIRNAVSVTRQYMKENDKD
jgi:hypothetical protein